MIRFIVAIDAKRGLANNTGIPWKLSEDKKYFSEKTKNGIVVMGYRTYLEFDKPLNNRQNFVVSNDNSELRTGFTLINEVDHFIEQNKHQLIWIIGGAGVFSQTINYADELYITQINKDFHCTKFFPNYTSQFELTNKSELFMENGVSFDFEIWKRKSSRE